MQKLSFLLLCFALAIFGVQAQKISPQLINTTGNTLSHGAVIVDYSVGEIVINSLNSSSNYLTQGLLQPTKKKIVTALDGGTSMETSTFLYPNPVVEKISIHCPTDYSADIYTQEGIKVRAIEVNKVSYATDLAKGLYIVKILDTKNTIVSTLKFIKL